MPLRVAQSLWEWRDKWCVRRHLLRGSVSEVSMGGGGGVKANDPPRSIQTLHVLAGWKPIWKLMDQFPLCFTAAAGG